MRIQIAQIGCDQTIAFAAAELRRYLARMDPQTEALILAEEAYDPSKGGRLWLGLDPALSQLVPEVADGMLDDALHIDVSGGAGVITGSNARSVLLGVYRFLRENGVRFLRPGCGGEYIPQKDTLTLGAHISEKPSYRHRGVCIEGAVSWRHVVNMIDWLPKAGMNMYFTQFFTPTVFFKRWYEHRENPHMQAGEIDKEEVAAIQRKLVDEIKRRGLCYHAVGHGWTCEPFGVEGDSWDVKAYDIPPETNELFAFLDGKRALFGGRPLNTNLCYGNPSVRERMTDSIVAYCRAHPQVDYVHFWLADGTNNHCECDLCKDTLPADFYVEMLNTLDEKLAAAGLPTRVVFLVYVDLLWAPQKQVIHNTDRFVLMFAPITRTYSSPFMPQGVYEGALAPYARNRNAFPRSVAENLARLKEWETAYEGDSFDFDYHFMWDHLRDVGHYRLPEVLMTDMKNLRDIGLGGMLSCQTQRAFFPNSLGMCGMAAALWDRTVAFETFARAYYEDAYAEDGGLVHAYMRTLSDLVDPAYLRREKPAVDAAQADRFDQAVGVVDRFRPVIDRNINRRHAPMPQRFWSELEIHADMVTLLARALSLRARGEAARAGDAFDAVRTYVQMAECRVHDSLDVFEYIQTIGALFVEE